MTRNEVINFLHTTYHIPKGEMSTIAKMIDQANKFGFEVQKNGVDDYTLLEACAIKDFRKPLIIHKEVKEWDQVNGVPISDLICTAIENPNYMDPFVWAYLAKKQDGDVINLNDYISSYDLYEQVWNFDAMALLGYIEEDEHNLHFYYEGKYGIQLHAYMPEPYNSDPTKRFTPIVM